MKTGKKVKRIVDKMDNHTPEHILHKMKLEIYDTLGKRGM